MFRINWEEIYGAPHGWTIDHTGNSLLRTHDLVPNKNYLETQVNYEKQLRKNLDEGLENQIKRVAEFKVESKARQKGYEEELKKKD